MGTLSRASALVALALLVSGCAVAASRKSTLAGSTDAARSDGSPLCEGLTERFVGLPSAVDANRSEGQIPPLAGSWWIRRCTTERHGTALAVRLEGPGWYWVEASESGIRLEQQVPFALRTEVTGTFKAGYRAGLASLWFKPTEEAHVELEASNDLELHGDNAWGSVVRRLPLLPVRSLVAESLSRQASAAIRTRLRNGATVTYELLGGQSDVALGQLDAGEKPQHPFDDGAPWLANDRWMLAPAAAQVLGPLEPASDLSLDFVVESGPGVVYRAVCKDGMAENLGAVMNGTPERMGPRALVAEGKVLGTGKHESRLNASACPFYVVLSTAGNATTLAALRVRG
jgi:hypothetical protein